MYTLGGVVFGGALSPSRGPCTSASFLCQQECWLKRVPATPGRPAGDALGEPAAPAGEATK
jgi:hypothetical protein